ncbi:MAG: FtsX-like permease family protein [Planctomycetota bacterium]
MHLRKLVWREMFERRSQLATSFLAILLGVAVVVSIKNITFFSEKAVARQLDALGANVLVLPKSVSLQDYYSADMQNDEFPEEYVTRLAMSDLQGLDNLSPKLSVPVKLRERSFTLTGILPKSEFQAKAMWAGAGIFSRPAEGCGTVADVPGAFRPTAKETLVRQRVIEDLGDSEVLIGADVAAILGVNEGENLDLLGRTFTVIATLPQTGTVDDSRIFAHLHTVQDMAAKGPVINAIEIVGCCKEISAGLVQKINKLLPDAKVVTVTQVVDTQVSTNRMMARLSLVFLGIIVLVGGASIANYMYANVFERRREIGTLMALGAGSSFILKMFLLKALLLGMAGGICGYLLGTVLAVALGPRLAGIPVLPMPMLIPWALGISILVALAASYFPARRAARLDPCATLQEV